MIHTSLLMRAQMTAMLVMSQHSSAKSPIMQHTDAQMVERSAIFSTAAKDDIIPVYADWRLNERYYGELQGANKAETKEKYGAQQVHIWRRSFDVPPPEGESLEMTCERTLPYFEQRIMPQLAEGKHVLVAAHGNSLRSIIMHIEQLTKEQILNLELATGVPRLYQYRDGALSLQQ